MSPSPELLLTQKRLEQLALLKRRKLEWVDSHRIYFYAPYSSEQARFHTSKAHTRLVVGSNRSGKTTCGAVEDISFWLGFRPWLLPEELKSLPIQELLKNFSSIPDHCKTPIKTPVKVLVVVADWDVADDIWTTGTAESAGKLKLYIPKGALECAPERNNMGNICRFRCINGSILDLDTQKSFINDPQSFEGRRLDVAHYDEPPKRDLRVAVHRGLVDRHGYEIFTMTPLTEPWIKTEIFDKASTLGPEKVETFHLQTEENPYISKEGWQNYLETLNEDEKEARGKGKWVFLKGLVYPEFKARLAADGGNICDPIPIEWVRDNGTVYVSIDPHSRQPMTAILLIADVKGRMIVWREVYSKDLIEDFCAKIKSHLTYEEEEKGKKILKELPVMRWLCDPIAFNPDPIDGLTWADEFFNNGIPVEEAPKRKSAGILKVRSAFKENKLFICSNCVRTLYEVQHYVYAEWKSKDSRAEKEVPVDKDDHTLECLYRIVLLDPTYVPQDKRDKPIRAFEYV